LLRRVIGLGGEGLLDTTRRGAKSRFSTLGVYVVTDSGRIAHRRF
jgi:hypothetical protein